MKTIRIRILDAHPLMPRTLLEFVADRFHFELVDENPDFVLHSTAGREVLRYNGVRIGYIGENLVPDFNISDYALGNVRMSFGDRYLRVPCYRIWNKDRYRLLAAPRAPVADVAARKGGFCSCVVSNGNRDPFFARLFEALGQYQTIDSGGRWRNNVGGPVADKIRFTAKYKFALAFENTCSPGYISEKIVDAMVSDAIPIFWGAPDVALDFNPKAFVNCHEFRSIEAVVDRIREIDQNRSLYLDMLSEPWLPGGNELPELTDGRIAAYLTSIFEQTGDSAYRRNRTFWGAAYQAQERRAWFKPPVQMLWLLRDRMRRLRQVGPTRALLRQSLAGMRKQGHHEGT